MPELLRNKKAITTVLAMELAVAACGRDRYAAHPASPPAYVPDTRVKTSACVSHEAMPDHACTPGAIFAGVTAVKICVKGYANSVRDVPEYEKQAVYKEYGVASHRPYQYEVDHLISLELGGSNSIANLWPEAARPAPGYHQKDKVENYLHSWVCENGLSDYQREQRLAEAQREIATDWVAVYQRIQ